MLSQDLSLLSKLTQRSQVKNAWRWLCQQRQFYPADADGGVNFYTPNKGICRGCSLSPLLGGFYLYPLDQYFASQRHLYYQRYMDDILIFARSRWHLRKAVRDLNHFLEGYGFEQHPDKTFIGKTEKSFDWLGYQLNHQGICGVAPRTLQKHREKLHRLYEQARCQKLTPSETRQRVVDYQQRWLRWLNAGLQRGCTPNRVSIYMSMSPCVARTSFSQLDGLTT